MSNISGSGPGAASVGILCSSIEQDVGSNASLSSSAEFVGEDFSVQVVKPVGLTLAVSL